MKRYLSLLFLVTSLTVSAQVNKTVTFNFNAPSSFKSSPELIPNPSNGGSVNVTGTVFTNEDIQLSFESVGGEIGAQFNTEIKNNSTTYNLTLGDRTHFVFSGLNDAKLKKITYPETDISGDLYLVDNKPGNFVSSQHSWTSGSSDVSKVIFQSSGGSDPTFHSITVEYTTPSDILKPAYSISEGSSVPYFKELKMTFDRSLSLQSGSGISISNGANVYASINGNEVTLSVNDTIKTDGSYTITVPAKCFKASDGYENAALTFSFSVNTPKNTFLPVSITPADSSEVAKLGFPTIAFSRPVKVTGLKGSLTKVGDSEWANDLSFIKSGNSKVTIESETIVDSISDKGVFVIQIPEGAITDGTGAHYNPAITLTYYVGGEKNPNKDDQPQPEPTVSDTPTMKAAKSLLADQRIGKAGYPSKESEEYQALLKLTTDPIGTTQTDTLNVDAELIVAMGKLYQSHNIVLPESGKYYKIFGQNSAGKKAYLCYSDGSVEVTQDASSAAAFEVELKDEAIAFKTKDGKYLQVLNSNTDYDGITVSHVSDSYTPTNGLTLSKFEVEKVDSTVVFGLVTMFGTLGNGIDESKSSYSQIRYDNLSIPASLAEKATFEEKLSAAFGFEETTKQGDISDLPSVDTEFKLEPETIQKGTDQLVVTLQNGNNVKRDETISPTILDKDKNLFMSSATIYKATKENSFIVVPTDCNTQGTYYLVLPEGLFTYTLDGKEVKNKTCTLQFEVGSSSKPEDTSEFNYIEGYPQLSVLNSGSDFDENYAIKDTQLNNVIFTYDTDDITGLAPDETVEVSLYKIKNQVSTPTLITTGHFEKFSTSDASVYALKLVWDNEIKENSLDKSVYAITYPDAAFGDENFEKWLADSSSVNKSDCYVNKADHWYFSVDNDNPTSINNVKTDKNGEKVIYDLQGRRVNHVSKTGIYIVNGKKTVIRK